MHLWTAKSLHYKSLGFTASPYEVSYKAMLTSTAFLLEYPVPHARFLKDQVQGYEIIDIWGDSLLNTSTHGAAALKAPHDNIAKEIASIATGVGSVSLQWNAASHIARVHHENGGI